MSDPSKASETELGLENAKHRDPELAYGKPPPFAGRHPDYAADDGGPREHGA